MITLAAPYQAPKTTSNFPSPTFNDSRSPLQELNRMYSKNNIRYVYVKRKYRERLNYTLILPLGKLLELQAFVEAYVVSDIKLTNHLGEIWKVKFVSEPFSYTEKTRDGRTEILLSFEGVRIYVPDIEC